MAVVTFAGTNLWSDASSGVGSVEWNPTPGKVVRQFEPLLAVGAGVVAKQISDSPGEIIVSMRYNATDAQLEALRTVFQGKRTSYGSLVLPTANGGSTTYANCVMDSHQISRGGAILDGSTLKDTFRVTAYFVQLKGD